MIKYLLIQTSIADYRQRVLDLIVDDLGDDFLVLTGSEYFDPSTKTNVFLPKNMKFITNIFIFNRKILFQFGGIWQAIFADSLILEFNPRIITNWIIVFFRLLLTKKTVFWGHAWGRDGRLGRGRHVRRFFRSLSDILVVYTESQKRDIEYEGSYKGKIIVAPNALYSIDQMKPIESNLNRHSFLYVGRLVRDKFPERLIFAFHKFYELNRTGRLVIVGSGPLEFELKNLAIGGPGRDHIFFHGHIADPIVLRSIYEDAFFTVSPGYVGLSITQSFGFGVPMIISLNEPHSPEIEAAILGINCLFFDCQISDDLFVKMNEAWNNYDYWVGRSEHISSECSSRYSADIMSKSLIAAFKFCK